MIIGHPSRPLFGVGCTTNRGVDNAHHLRRRGQLLRCARKFRSLCVVGTIAVGGVGNANHLRRGMGLPRCSMDTLLRRFATLINNGGRHAQCPYKARPDRHPWWGRAKLTIRVTPTTWTDTRTYLATLAAQLLGVDGLSGWIVVVG